MVTKLSERPELGSIFAVDFIPLFEFSSTTLISWIECDVAGLLTDIETLASVVTHLCAFDCHDAAFLDLR